MIDRKYVFSIISGIIIVPCLALGWTNIREIWASPENIDRVDKKVDKTKAELDEAYKTNQQLSKLIVEQNARIEKNEALDDLRAKNQAEQLSLIAELKRKK